MKHIFKHLEGIFDVGLIYKIDLECTCIGHTYLHYYKVVDRQYQIDSSFLKKTLSMNTWKNRHRLFK